MNPLLRVLAVVCVLGTVACESPTDGFEAFYAAVADGKPDVALSRLTDKARSELQAGAKAAHMDLDVALRNATVRTTVKDIVEVERSGASATLEVTDALGQHARTRMVKQGGRWLIDGDAP